MIPKIWASWLPRTVVLTVFQDTSSRTKWEEFKEETLSAGKFSKSLIKAHSSPFKEAFVYIKSSLYLHERPWELWVVTPASTAHRDTKAIKSVMDTWPQYSTVVSKLCFNEVLGVTLAIYQIQAMNRPEVITSSNKTLLMALHKSLFGCRGGRGC